jgi:pseudouridine-5'-phosphate glycosidase
VPVVGVGTDTLPAFYAASSGLPVPGRVDGVAEAAAVLSAWRALAAGNGLLLTVPVPADAALPPAETDAAIATATAEAHAQGIAGAAVTPFVLQRVSALTAGRTLAANRALLVNNAKVAAEIAVAATG